LREYFTWCQKKDLTSRMDSVGVQSRHMDSKSENPPERCKRFRQHVELMFSGPLVTKKEEEKWSYLLIWCGEKGNANIRSDVTDEDRKKLKTYFERFSNHLKPKCNPVFSRFKFHKWVRTEAETVEKFVTDLKLLARECSFKVIPQYCIAHPVLRIITRNWQQNIMAVSLAGKLAREKNGRFGKAWLGKRGGNLWQRRKRKLSESVEIVAKCKNISPFFLEHGGIFLNKGKP